MPRKEIPRTKIELLGMLKGEALNCAYLDKPNSGRMEKAYQYASGVLSQEEVDAAVEAGRKRGWELRMAERAEAQQAIGK